MIFAHDHAVALPQGSYERLARETKTKKKRSFNVEGIVSMQLQICIAMSQARIT